MDAWYGFTLDHKKTSGRAFKMSPVRAVGFTLSRPAFAIRMHGDCIRGRVAVVVSKLYQRLEPYQRCRNERICNEVPFKSAQSGATTISPEIVALGIFVTNRQLTFLTNL